VTTPAIGSNPRVSEQHLNKPCLAPCLTTSHEARPASTDDACLDAFQRELDYLLRTFERLGVGPPDVEDLAHEVFLILRRTWSEYDASRPFKPYLFGIAFRVASSYRRRRWREVPYAFVDAPDHAPSPERELEANRARALVLAALQQVPLPRRAVLLMHDLDQAPMHEVAATLAIPLFTAYSRLRKARLELEASITRIQRRSARR
jgi:RNA polymerase sigma-70 factor (ECF subfamily)